MNIIFTRYFYLKNLLVLFLYFILLPGFTQNPATLTGIVTNCTTASTIIGAKISVGNLVTYSVSGGIYSITISPPGTYTITCSKAGYQTHTSNPIVFNSGALVNLSICLNESANPPTFVNAVTDSSVTPPRVSISWQVPRGDYELLYDDGIMDDFTAWSVQGNMNAVRFTPLAYPATVKSGSINIGTSANYPSGSDPFVPFQVDVYDASGPGGMPGVKIAGPVDVLPSNFGWVDFSILPSPVINSGNFYLVMIQGGNAPNAAGLAIDETNLQFRSFSHFVTSGSSPWIPGAGNFMMRAVVNGPGGPGLLQYAPVSVTGYSVSRLRQGEELNPVIWTPVGSGTSTQIYDNAWSNLSCGPWRWAAKAVYSGNRFSDYSFSNVIGKCWTVNTTVKVTLSCDSAAITGIIITLSNLVYTDTVYVKPADNSGSATFPNFWKGTYQLKVTRFGYQDYIQNISISKDTTLNVLLRQTKTEPSGLVVNDSSLIARWNKPVGSVELLHEAWQSGSFSTNAWSVQGPNWTISQAIGNPMPSAMFGWSPAATNYTEMLTSKPIVGQNSPVLRLQYDIFLNNYGTTSLNQMAVEIWDGSDWNLLRNYNNSNGSIQWTKQDIDISPYTGLTFKVRFRTYGGDSYDINNWNIDNIVIEGHEPASVAGQCVLGYDFYLNNVLSGFTADTFYQIQPGLVQYGNTYTACVNAVYGSGTSSLDCVQFSSSYLSPPSNLQGNGVYDAAYLSWGKPLSKMKGNAPEKFTPPGLTGYIIYRDGVFIDSVKNADTLRYVDHGLYPGTYFYKVASVYDLTSYGHPGMFAQSYPAGPVDVAIDYGIHLPFTETWEAGNFNYHQWTFDIDSANWSVNTTHGNPSPDVQFSWSPQITNYSSSMISPVLNASDLTCSNIWLDFDYQLLDHNATGNEKLNVEVFYNNIWQELETYANNGTTVWLSRHLNITPVKGKAFKIRFRASGINSNNIVNWNVDNINAYAVCKPPKNLTADSSGTAVRLTWSSPVCEDGFPLHEGFEESTFPPPDWSQIITNVNNITWEQTSSNSHAGVHSGLHAAGLTSDYVHQDEWLIANNIEVTGDLEFWSYAYQGSTHSDHYYVKLSEDQGAHWQTLLDMSALPLFPSTTGYNEWQVPYVISLSSHLGQVVNIAWQALDGDNQGLWYDWGIDDCSVGSKKIDFPDKNTQQNSYVVYRQKETGDFLQIGSGPVSDTTYYDQGLDPTTYRYYVTAFNPDCSVSTPSDTVQVNLVTGVSSHARQYLTVFPNPANDFVIVRSSVQITAIDVFNYLGQRITPDVRFFNSEGKVNVSMVPQGVYFFRIKTGEMVKTYKISVVH